MYHRKRQTLLFTPLLARFGRRVRISHDPASSSAARPRQTTSASVLPALDATSTAEGAQRDSSSRRARCTSVAPLPVSTLLRQRQRVGVSHMRTKSSAQKKQHRHDHRTPRSPSASRLLPVGQTTLRISMRCPDEVPEALPCVLVMQCRLPVPPSTISTAAAALDHSSSTRIGRPRAQKPQSAA